MAQTLQVNGNNNAAGHEFTNLYNAVQHAKDNHADLTTAGGIDIPISITDEDTAVVDLLGFTNATQSYYLNIYTTEAARNTGGAWDPTKYRLTRYQNYSRPLIIETPYTRITGLQIAQTGTGTSAVGAVGLYNGTNVLIDACRIYSSSSGTGTAGATVYLYTGVTNSATIRNTIIYGVTVNAGLTVGQTSTATLENVTIYMPNGTYCVYLSGTASATNVYMGGPADTIYGTFSSATKVATSDSSGSEAGLRNIAAAVGSGAYFTNITAGSEDFRLASSLSPLYNAGSDMSGSYLVDITGSNRDSTFDIGAFEFLQTYQYGRPSSDVSDGNWLNELQSNTNLYASIDETAANLSDADYIQSGTSPVDDTYTFGITGIRNPGAGTVAVRVRAKFL